MRKIENKTPVTLGFVCICVLTLIMNYITEEYSNLIWFSVYHADLNNIPAFLRFFTHIFGHVDFEHFAGNILLILVLGPALELRYGSKRLATYMIITAFVTGFLHFILFPDVMLLGASGIVFLMIVLNAYISTSNDSIALSFIIVIVVYLGKELYAAIFIEDYISQFAHLIGGVCGWVLGYLYNYNEQKKIIENQ